MKRTFFALGAALALAACGSEPRSDAQETGPQDEAAAPETEVSEPESEEAATAGFEPADYGDMANWLCHPDKADDACDVDLDTTIVQADGSLETEPFEAAETPPIDCFYIYPTVSLDDAMNSDLVAGDEERRVAEQQAARLAAACRVYAPMYRQRTLKELRQMMMTGESAANAEMRYSDILGSWQTYLETGNDGRGVVLIGHSQGAGMISELMAKDLFGTPAEDLIVSAMPIGFTVPADPESGGIGPMPPCETLGQTGCVISYVSFRATNPPPASSFFGRVSEDGRASICVNPAEVSGDDGALDPRLPANLMVTGEAASFAEGAEIETPFATLPGFLEAGCEANDTHSWLSVTVNADPEDPRTDELTGDVVVAGQVLQDWGLHLVDMNIAMGNLIEIIAAQGEAWTSEDTGAD